MRSRAFNPQAFLETLCYTAFAALLFYLVDSGRYLSYVTPRIGPYLIFTALVMLLYAAAGAVRLFRPQHKVRAAHCFVLAVPILLLLLPNTPLRASDVSAQYGGGAVLAVQSAATPRQTAAPGTQAAATSAAASAAVSAPAATTAATSAAATTAAAQGDVDVSSLKGLDEENRSITVDSKQFYPWLVELYENLDAYEGYRIAVTGFILNDPEQFASDEFVAARLAMNCCAADLVPVGLLCRYDGAAALEADAWVTVEGTVAAGEYMGEPEPQIRVEKITPAEPIAEYIVPY